MTTQLPNPAELLRRALDAHSRNDCNETDELIEDAIIVLTAKDSAGQKGWTATIPKNFGEQWTAKGDYPYRGTMARQAATVMVHARRAWRIIRRAWRNTFTRA